MGSTFITNLGGGTAVTLSHSNHPTWMPLTNGTGRVFTTVIAGPVSAGKSAMLAHLQAAALEAGYEVTYIDPLNDPDAATRVETACDQMQARVGSRDRTARVIAIDNTEHLAPAARMTTRLQQLVDLGPKLGVGLTFTAETVRGSVKGPHLPDRVDNVIVLGTQGGRGGALRYGVHEQRCNPEYAGHYLHPVTRDLIPFHPILVPAA